MPYLEEVGHAAAGVHPADALLDLVEEHQRLHGLPASIYACGFLRQNEHLDFGQSRAETLNPLTYAHLRMNAHGCVHACRHVRGWIAGILYAVLRAAGTTHLSVYSAFRYPYVRL